MPHVLAFLGVAILVVVTPGPDMALVTRNALAGGRRAAVQTALGVITGTLVWMAASGLGLAALLQASAPLFTLVRVAGAAYLVYLGIRTLLAVRSGTAESNAPAASTRRLASVGSPYHQGLLSNLLNPKIAVFFTSLIPQFVTPGPTATLEALALAGIFSGVGMLWLMPYALLAGGAGSVLRLPAVKRSLDALTGVVLVGLGVRLAADTT